MTVEEMWDCLMEEWSVSRQTLEVATAINGYSKETMEDILYAVSGYRFFGQWED